MLGFRTATPEDAPALGDLLSTVDGEAPPDPETVRDFFANLQRYPNAAIWLTEDQGEVAGTYTLFILDLLGHRGTPLALVESVVVHPDKRSRGIGAAMMHHARARARDAGCYKLMLSSNLKRERAHAFYHRLGFERHGYSFMVEP